MLRYFLIITLLVGLLSPLWIVALAIESYPKVRAQTSLSVDDVENARRLLRENNPRWLADGERKEIVLQEREVNLMLSYALPDSIVARVSLGPSLAHLAASAAVPANVLGSYLNIDAVFALEGNVLEPISISAGRLRFPGWLVGSVSALGVHAMRIAVPDIGSVLDSIKSVGAHEGALAVNYEWDAELLDRLKSRRNEWVLPEELRDSILVYYDALAYHSRTLRSGASLAEVIGPLFATARIRSASGLDPRRENRALILALGMAIQYVDPNRLLPEGSRPIEVVRGLPVTLRGRRDLAQHFVVSAAIAAGGSSKVADLAGVFKELSDSLGGSGFSFPDLLADRAGVVFAENAMGRNARLVQDRLAGTSNEAVFMPPIDRLPEGLQELEFRNRYRDIDTPAYARVRSEVESRIRALALHR